MTPEQRPPRIAVIGSRDYPEEEAVRGYVRWLAGQYPGCVIVSGGARGVDTWAEAEARVLGMPVEIYEPDWSQGKSAALARNQTIVDRADSLIAFWDGRSTGTAHAIGLARRAGKRVKIFGPREASSGTS